MPAEIASSGNKLKTIMFSSGVGKASHTYSISIHPQNPIYSNPPPFSYIYIHIYLSGKWIITVRARAGTSHPSVGTYKVSNIRTIRVFRPQIAVVAIHIEGICPCQIHYLTEHA